MALDAIRPMMETYNAKRPTRYNAGKAVTRRYKTLHEQRPLQKRRGRADPGAVSGLSSADHSPAAALTILLQGVAIAKDAVTIK